LKDCVKENMLMDDCEVNTINESYFDKNVLITGGSDNKVKVWSLTSNSIIKAIECHSSEVIGSIIIENPFLKENNSCILTFANFDDEIYLTSLTEEGHKAVKSNVKLGFKGAVKASPLMQIVSVRDDCEEDLNIVTICQDPNESCLIKLKLR